MVWYFKSGLRYFHQSSSIYTGIRAKDLVKMINKSSITNSENETKNWRKDKTLPEWKRQKLSLNEKLKGEKWNPNKKLSRDEIETVRFMKTQYPTMTTRSLGEHFKVSPEVIRRILKTKWTPNESEMVKIQERWKRRGARIIEMYENNEIESDNIIHNHEKVGIYNSRKIIISSDRSGSDFRVSNILDRSKGKKDRKVTNKNPKLSLLLKDI